MVSTFQINQFVNGLGGWARLFLDTASNITLSISHIACIYSLNMLYAHFHTLILIKQISCTYTANRNTVLYCMCVWL